MPTKYIRQIWARSGKPYIPAFDRPADQPLPSPWTLELGGMAILLILLCIGAASLPTEADDPNRAEHARLARAEQALLQERARLAKAFQEGRADAIRKLPAGCQFAVAEGGQP